jgi:hypothetical protein
MLVMEFESLWPPFHYRPKSFPSRLGTNAGIQLYNVQHLSVDSPNLYRFAILVIMSYIKNNVSGTSNYLSKYLVEAQKSIDNDSLLQVVFASYVVAVYSLMGGDSMKFALRSCHNFCKSIVGLTKSRMITDDWIELLWQDVLTSLYYVYRDSALFRHPGLHTAELMESLGQVEGLLQASHCLLPSETHISNLPLSMTTEEICLKVKSLSIYLQFYLDHFLFRKTHDANLERLQKLNQGLYDILDRITRLISHLSPISNYIYHAYPKRSNSGLCHYTSTTNTFLHFPNVQPRGLKVGADPEERDTALALLYAFARLLKNALKRTADDDENLTDIHDSAIAICRLCGSFPEQSRMVALLAKRSLFWAGLVLTESRFNSG